MDPDPTPDALMIPFVLSEGPRASGLPNLDRTRRICEIAEPLLKVDYDGGERAMIRKQIERRAHFVTRDADDTIYHPDGRDRYRWVDAGNGTLLGYLIHADS